MYTAAYQEKRTFLKYDDKNIIAYLNEVVLPNYQHVLQEGGLSEPYTAYQYEGTEKDGGTIMPCADATSYDELVNAVIRTRYSQSQENAIHRHRANESEGWEEEWFEFDNWCENAKVTVRQWLNM